MTILEFLRDLIPTGSADADLVLTVASAIFALVVVDGILGFLLSGLSGLWSK